MFWLRNKKIRKSFFCYGFLTKVLDCYFYQNVYNVYSNQPYYSTFVLLLPPPPSPKNPPKQNKKNTHTKKTPKHLVIRCDSCTVKWGLMQENLSLGFFEQQRRRPACASSPSDQYLCYSHPGKYDNYTYKISKS